MKHASIAMAAVAAAATLAASSDAALTRSTITSISANSTLTGYPGTWSLAVNNAAVTDSRTADSRSWSGNSNPAGYGGSGLVLYTKQTYRSDIYNGGFVDWITLQHDVGSSMLSSWNASGSLTFVFDTAVKFYWDPNAVMGRDWTYNGSSIAQGTRFEAGTYVIGFSAVGGMPAGQYIREWNASAYVAPVPVPAPGALAPLGLAGFAARRRRA